MKSERTVDAIQRSWGVSKQEAERMFKRSQMSIYDLLGQGANYDETEDFMMYELGLEMDYIDEFFY